MAKYCINTNCYNLIGYYGICARCTKKACIRALDMSGDQFPFEKALAAYVCWPMTMHQHVSIGDVMQMVTSRVPMHSGGDKVDRMVLSAFDLIGNESTELSEATVDSPAALLLHRQMAIDSIYEAKFPRDVLPLINAIDDVLRDKHQQVVCRACGVYDGIEPDDRRRVCRECVRYSKADIAMYMDLDHLYVTTITRATSLLAPISRIIAGYVRRR